MTKDIKLNDALDVEVGNISVIKGIDRLNNAMTLELGENTIGIAATFGNLGKLQSVMGKGETALLKQFSSGNISIADVTRIIFYCLDKKDMRFTLEYVGDTILKSGKYSEYIAAVTLFLSLLFYTGEDNEGEGKL